MGGEFIAHREDVVRKPEGKTPRHRWKDNNTEIDLEEVGREM
jgi:hypothetical protein